MDGTISWSTDNIKCVLVDSGLYTPNLVTDQFLSVIPMGARVAVSTNLTGKTSTAGVADADDVTFALVTGSSAEYIVIYQDSGVDATSQLIAFIDTATGLPVTPGGGNIVIEWSSGASKIFKL